MGKESKQNKHVKAEAKQIKQNQGFWASSCARMNKPACTSKIMCT